MSTGTIQTFEDLFTPGDPVRVAVNKIKGAANQRYGDGNRSMWTDLELNYLNAAIIGSALFVNFRMLFGTKYYSLIIPYTRIYFLWGIPQRKWTDCLAIFSNTHVLHQSNTGNEAKRLV